MFDLKEFKETLDSLLSNYIGAKNTSKIHGEVTNLLSKELNQLNLDYLLDIKEEDNDCNQFNIKIDIEDPTSAMEGYLVITSKAAHYLDKLGKAAIVGEIVKYDLVDNSLEHIEDGWITDLSSYEIYEVYYACAPLKGTLWKNTKNVRFRLDNIDGAYVTGILYDQDKRYSHAIELDKLSMCYVLQEKD